MLLGLLPLPPDHGIIKLVWTIFTCQCSEIDHIKNSYFTMKL